MLQGGQWCQTISTLEAMQAAGAEPHAAVISSVIDALWHTGIVWAQAKAALLFEDSIRCAAAAALLYCSGLQPEAARVAGLAGAAALPR
jgi:hypothetical protein